MKKFILTLVTILVSVLSYTQNANFDWAKGMGGPDFDNPNSISVDDNGNVYTTGYFAGTSDFDPGTGVFNLTAGGSGDIYISKLDADGDFVWAIAMGSPTFDRGQAIE